MKASLSHHADELRHASSPASEASSSLISTERRMRRGKTLILSGFAVAIVGIIGYCIASFGAEINLGLAAPFLENRQAVVGPALGVIALGTLLWLAGSYLFLSSAMDSATDGQEPHG